jgi:2-polyprenyl-6-methoxyphenol hydroxylase-like FAD-dependent oxidoreductase
MAFTRGSDSGIIRGRDAVYWFVSARGTLNPFERSDLRRQTEKYTAPFDEPLRDIARATPDRDIRLEALADCEPIRPWGIGRVTLLGDAAHPMLPHVGQGAAQALEDAVALGLALGTDSAPAAALRRYEDVRGHRTARVVRLSRHLSRIRTTESAIIGAARALAVRLTPRAALHLTRLLPDDDPHGPLR